MRVKNLLIAILLPIVAIILYRAFNFRPANHAAPMAQEFSVTIAATPAAPSVLRIRDAVVAADVRIDKTPEKKITELAPSLKTLRAEVKKDPHSTPPSMLKFAATLAEKLDQADTHEESVGPVFKEIEDCVLDIDLAQNIRALCLSNLKRMSQKRADYLNQYERARSQAGKEISRLAD